MTSTNDGKDVKSNQTSGHKSKSYYIELYTSLEKALSGDSSLEERTAHVCEAWRRVYSLYQHSAASTHPHLLSWLQRHTANTVLQSKWAKSKNEQARLTNAIDALVAEATAAAAGREQHPWERLLLQRAAWFRKAVENPWDNPVLKSLINPNSEPVTDQQVLEWLISEHGIVLVTRLRCMVGAGNCDDLALLLASAVMDRVRAAVPHRADDGADDRVEEEDTSSFVVVLEREASFTADEWEMLTDMELVLLLKTGKRSRCIELAKLTPLRHGYKMVERLRKRLEISPRDKKLWKHAKEVATLVAQVVIARCMVLWSCSGAARDALYWCARALARLTAGGALRAVSTALAAPAATARHLHTFCAALSAECKELKTDVIMKPFICELYVRAITAGMNELEQLKLNSERASEARTYEQTLAGWFTQLGGRLTDSSRLRAECALTAFSVHPARKHYERVASTPQPPRLHKAQEPTPETISDYGSWANDSRTQSNLVKTSETLQLKQSQQHQANVLSTAILTEGEALGLEPELCQDLAVLLSGPRVKTLSWDMDREGLLENCRAYMEKTHGGTRAVTTELKFLNLDPDAYRHLPEEGDDEGDLFYGIEKGYEHEVQLEEPEDIWQNAFFDPEHTESANDSEVDRQSKKKTKTPSSEDDEDPLSNIAEAKKEKKKLAKEKRKERRKKSHTESENKDGSRERRKDKDKKTKKERKKDKSEQPTTGSLTSLLGMKVTKMSAQVQDGEKRVRKKKERRREPTTMFSYVSVTDSDYDSQGKSSQVSEHDPNVLVDGVFSMDELRSPGKPVEGQKPVDNTNTLKNNATVQSPVINEIKTRPMSSPILSKASGSSGVSKAKSSCLTPNHLGPRHVVNSKVKSSIAKLLQFRRNKSQVRDIPRPPPSHTPTTPTTSLVGMKIYNPKEVPKVCLSKKQSKQLEAISKEVNDLFNEARSSTVTATPELSNKLRNQSFNNVQKQQQQNSSPPQNYNESQKHSKYTQHSPIRPDQQVLIQSPSSVIHSNYTSPIKMPEHMRTHALNLSPPKPTITYQPFHKSMQNLSTDTKYDPPKKPQLINDPNYFSQQHAKSNSSQLSPRIISNTCIKPPSQTPTNVQQYYATVKDNITKSPQTYSNLHGVYTPRGPEQSNNQITISKNDVKHGQKQLGSSMQNISDVPGSFDATKCHIPTPNMQHGQADKQYSVISQRGASNTSPALHNNNTTASRCLPVQRREKVDKTPEKPNIKDNFDEYLKELVRSINASSGHDKNVTVALNKEVKVTSVPPSAVPAKRVDSVTPQCAKQLIQQKKPDNAPNTFSRRSYMHKNKQSGNKVNITDAVTFEINRTIMDRKISKAKFTQHEVTISRVGPNTQGAANVKRKLDQPCSRLQRDCPVLSGILDSSEKNKIHTVTNTTTGYTSGNQPNREDADLLLLLRNQAILKPNVSNVEVLTSDASSGQASNNSQVKVDSQNFTTHQGLVGTKVRSINMPDNTLENEKSLDWKCVMDAIIAQKTEPLGPKALDLALKKEYRRPQSSSRAHSSDKDRLSGQSSSHNKPLEPKKREYQSSKASSSRKSSTEKHSAIPKPREFEIVKKVCNEVLNRPEVSNKHFSLIPKDLPQTPVIPNSDYDVLDDLIDDDLRRELGEISSDEDTYSAPPNAALLKGKTYTNIPKTFTNIPKAANICKEKPHIVNPKIILPKNETNVNIVDSNRRFPVNTCSITGYPNVINNSSHPTSIENKAIAKPETARQHIATSTIITNQVAQDTANNIVTRCKQANPFMTNVIPANMIIASAPQPAVVVIRQDFYDPYPLIRIHENQVNAGLCTLNQNMYTLNATPNIAVYQTTQYAAPVINPVIIGNATTTTNVSNATAMSNDHDTPDCRKDVSKQDQDCISLEDAIRLTDNRNQMPELPTNLDLNMNRNCERKVLSLVQEKHTNENVEKDSHLKKLPVDDGPFKTDEDRIKLKRQSLMNRKISHAGYHPPIPLTYTPLSKKNNLEKQLQQEMPKNGFVKPNLKSVPNSISDNEKCVVISTSVTSPQSVANNENIESTDQASSAKENQKSCRRIWLRSSNKIRNKVSPVKRLRVSLKRNKIKLKVNHNVTGKFINAESENKDNVKTPTRISNRLLNKTKLNEHAANNPASEETTQQNLAVISELIDFEEALSSSIVLKTLATNLGTDNTSKQESECKLADKKVENIKPDATVVEQHQNLNSIEDTKVASQSNRLEPTVVIEKLKSKLGDQLTIKSSLVKTSMKKPKVLKIKNSNRAVLRNKRFKCIAALDATSNKIIIKASPKNITSAAVGSSVPDNANKFKSVVILDQKVIKAAPIGTPLVRVETNKLVEQKVNEHTLAVGLPIPHDGDYKPKQALDDGQKQTETSKLNVPVANQRNTKRITAANLQPASGTSKVNPTAKDDVEVNDKVPAAVDDQKDIERTTASELQVIEDNTNIINSTLVDNRDVVKQTSAVELPALEFDLNESNKSEPKALDGQRAITPTGSTSCPNRSVSNTVGKKQGNNDSTDCNKASSALEAKNNQSRTFKTTTESLDSQKSFRATRTKSDTPTGSTPCPNQSVSTTVQKKQGNDSTDCNQALSELEAKNNQLQTTTMTESLESQKTFRATRTKSDTPTGSTPCPNQSVSSTVQKKQGNDSTDYNQASSELEEKNNQLQTTTMTESLESQKTFRATRTKSDTPTGSIPCPNQSVSTTVQKKQGNDSADCNQASSELEAKNNQSRELTTMTESLDSPKNLRAMKTKSDTVINKANTLVQPNKSLILLNHENPPKPNALSSKVNKTCFKPTVKLSPTSDNVNINHVPVIQKTNEEVTHITETGVVQSTTEILKTNSNDGDTNKDRQIVTGKSLCRGNIGEVLNVGQEKKNVQPNLNHHLPPNLTDVPNKDKQTSIKGDIKIEELPVEDNKEPHKKLVRITLPNGKVFRATIHGKMQGDFNSLFSDPTMRSILAGSLNDGKRYTVNYKQICKTNKENPNKILGTQIQNLNIKETKPRAVPIDTVNLISDDEDEVPTLLTCGFTTEFGKYTANVDKETFTMHQKKFNEKCEVKMYRDDIFKSNKTKPKRDVQSEKSSLLTRHKSKLLTNTNAPVVLNTPTNIIPEVVAHTDSLLLTRHKSKLLTNTNAPVVVNTPTNVIPEVVAHTDSSLLTRHKSKLLTNTNAPVVVNTPTNIIPEVVAHTDSSLLTRHKSKLLTNTNAPVVVNTPTNIIPEVVAHTDSSLLTRHKSKLITNTNAPVVLNTPTNIIPEVDAHTDSSLLTRHNSKLLTNTNAPVVLNTPTNIIPEVVAHTDSSLLTRHKSKLLTNTNAPVVVNTPTNIIPEVVAHTDISTRAQETPIATLKQADSTPKVNTANVIEIDDSSNDSIENPTPEIVDDIVEPVKKIVELKSLLLHDLGVGMDKNIGFPLPKQKSVNNLKNALLQDLGIVTTEDPVIDITADEENEDGIATDSQKEKERLQKDHVDHTTQNEDNKHITSIQTQNYQCFGHNPADDNIQSDERHKEMITKCQERNTLKKCVVRLVKCDNLIKKYERMKIMKKCYVKIERLNNSILNVSSPSLNENTNNQVTDHIEDANNEETNEINPENVEDFIEFDAEEPSGSPQLSRFPSLSILNNWDDDSQPLEIPYPTSPVMEIYDNMVELRNKQKTELFRDPEKLLSMICDSEWTVTKFGYRIEEILLRSSDIPASENKIVPDCDTLMVSGIEKHGILFDAPRLLTLTLKFLEDNPVVLYRLESMRSLRRISATKTAPNKLKRKTEEFVNDSVASKILKLGTLALNSLNSCINVIDGITFPDIEENMKIQSDASCINIESNNRILEFQPNDIATPVQDIEYDKQIYDSLRTLDIENSYPEKTRTDLIAECEENLCTRRTIEVTPINENINSYLEDTIVNADCNESMVYNKTEAVYKEERQGNHSSQPENIEGSSRILIEFQPIDMNRTLQNIEHDKPIDNSMRTLDIKNSYPEKSRIDMIAEYENNIRSRRIIELTSVNENTNSYLEDTIVTIDSSESTGDNKTEAVYKEGTRGTHNSQPQNIEGSIGVLIESQPRDMNITLQNIEYDKPMSTLNIENSEQEKSHTDLVAECEDNVYSNRTIEVAPVNKESKSNLEERILIAASLENIVGNKTEAVYNEETTTHSSSPENNKTKLNALCDKECRSPTLTVTHVHEETLLIADSDTSSPDIEAEEKSNEETQDYITKPEEIKTGGEEDCASPNGNVVSHVHEETLLIANFDISSPAVQAEEESKEETQDYITKPEEIKTGLQAESENYEECASPNGNVVSHVHEETLLIANFDISSPAVQAEEESKEETQDYITKPEEIKTGLQAESENYEECASPNGNVVSHFHEETLFIADSDTSSPGVQAEEQSKEETQDYITKPEDMKTGLQEQSENYAVCASPNVNASLVNKKTNRNAEDSVAIVDSNTSPTGDIIDENDKGLPQDSNFSDPDKAILDQYAQHINNKECLPPTISDPLINEHNNTYVSDSHKSPPDNKTEEKYTEETNDSGSPIEDIAKEPEPALRESDLATEECKVDASTPVYSCVSVEKPGSCRPSESYICDKNVTEVDSPFSNSIETGGNESQINATIERDEHASTEILHIDNSDRLDEITFDDNDLYEVVVDTHIDAGIGVVETLYEKSREPITVNVDSSGVGHQNCVVKFPIFIDSKKIAFNYHDYTKQPKKEEVVVTSASNYREECEVNNVKDLLTQGCASETGGIIVHKVKSKEEPCCEDKLSNSDVNTNESVPLKSNPECKYELIQEDDLLTVKIITENDKDENEARTACVGSNDSEEEKVVSPGSVDAGDDIDITGFEFEDMYVFPLNQSASNSNNTSNDSLGSELNSESGNCNTQIDLHNIDFHVIEPEITYSRKRKMGMRDIRVPAKKYRKGKNIDCSKQTTISIAELAYAKEYRRLLEYCSSVKFSYMRPFHKECIEVDDLMSNWPINNVCCDVPSDDADDHLFVDLRDTNCHQPPDPMTQTFVEEINYEYDTTDATPENPSSEATEVNFNMGFGEGSGRVIQILKKRESNISAATLSDVKQSQPVLKSVDLDDCNDVTRNKDDQIKKIRQHVNFIELRDKVRTFFKKSSVELKSDWLQNTKDSDFVSKCDDMFSSDEFPFDLCSLDYVLPLPTNAIVQVVQVGQLPVSAAAQNPVTCDPRVTQVSDASPSQCSVDNSPNDDSQSEIKTEYTELTTADLTLPLQEYAQQNQANLASNDSNLELTEQTISLEMEIKAEESPQIKVEMPDIKEEKSNSSDADLHSLTNTTPENMDYSFENNAAKSDATSVAYDSSEQNGSETFSQQRQQNGTAEKTDQIAHAMNAAGITTTPETVTSTRAHALVNILSQKIRQGSVNTTQTTTNTYSKTTSINAMALQQALAQILPPPLNQTGSSENNQAQSTPVGPQVLHIVQGKNASGNQITLVDNSQQSVISTPNATQVLHIVQNKNATSGQASNGTLTPQANSFSGLSLVDAGLQQGGNQLLHIVNTGNQKTASPGQLLKRVNLLTNLTNVQGSNEQKMVQFVCKSADGKAIQLNAPHQRSMVLRLQPIETPNVQAPPAKQAESQEPSPSPTGPASGKESANQQEIKSRSIYEENYAKFIQSSSSKTPGLEKSTSLPKFNQAFGKPVFQEGQKQGETANNNSHLPPVNSNTETAECSATDNAINLEHIGQISSPPLLLRKQPVVTSASQPNIVQQIKQTIAPMNIQTMHGGVIYTRQIPVNIGGGQTINLITVPSTELINDDSTKTQVQTNQGEIEPSIIKIVPQSQTTTNNESSQEESNNHASGSNENAQTTQPQPVLTQMRIKLPMLSKAPQMVPGARVVRPSFFQIQRNVIGGANQPVYQQLVLTAAPPLGQQTIRLPQAQTSRPAKAPSESQSSSESQMSTSTLEQLREFDMVLEQVKERSTVQPSINTNNSSFKIHTSSSDTTDGNASSNCSTESTPQVLYSIGNNQSLNVAYINRKTSVTTPTTSTYVRSPDSSGIADSPTSSTHVQISHTVTTDSSPTEMSSQSKPKVGSKSKSRPKSTSNPPNTLKLNTVPPKTSSQKPLEDEQTTQRILYILAEYKEQVENSPDKDKPAPRRRSNPPSNPGSSKRKKSSSSRRSGTRDMSPVHGEDTCRTMGSEDSSCGTSQGDCTESCLDSHSPQDSPRKVARKITFDQDITVTQPRPQPQRNVIVADGQTITVARGATGKPATAVLMPANYILPVSMVKGGQQIAIVTNRGPKLLTVGGEGGATNALLLQRLIGPAGLKPVLARPGVRHVRLPTAALHNLQAFNLATATTVQPPDSTASPSPGPTPPELVDTRANSSPWTDRDEVKPERGSSPEGSEPWNLPSSADVHEYTYEETVRTDMDRTVLDPIPDRYSPDMEAQRIFDKMFDVDSKKSYAGDSHDDSPRCAYDIDPSDCDDKAYQVVQKKDGSQRQHRLSHVSAAALRHKYAILEHELRLQKSLSEECEDLGVDSPSASELFPEAELLFAASPAHEHNQEHHSHTPQPHQSSIPQPDMDDQIATDHLIPREIDVGLGLGDVGIVAVSDDGSATIALDQEEFARSHPNTTFHSEPTDGEVQPFTIAGLKGRHITSTIFHSSAPATVLMTAPQASVISQAPDHSVKYEIENMIHSMPSSHNNDINLSSVLVKDDGLTRFDNILTDSRELHLTNTTSAIVHSSGNATQVIRRVCYEDDKRERDARYLIEEPDNLIAGDDAKMIAEDSSRDATMESMADVDDEGSSPERHAELFWESNSASERSEGRRPLDFSSDSDKCCKSPSFDETNSTDSSGVGAQMRLDTVIKEARGRGRGRGRGRSRSRSRSRSRDGSSAEEAPPLRTYPAKRSVSGKTRAGEREREPDAGVRRRASGRGVVKRGCPCCAPADPPPHAPPAPQPRKRPRMRKPTLDFHAPN